MLVRATPGWRTTASLDELYFAEDLGDVLVVFFSDHADPEGNWYTTHGEVRLGQEKYPYDLEAYKAIRQQVEEAGKPVILAGHYALAGGNRPSALLNCLLPLPASVKLHLHGHAHIGDRVWGAPDSFKKIAYVQQQAIPQINVSSLEHGRGSSIRSVVLDLYESGGFGVLFRDHRRAMWEEYYYMGAEVGSLGCCEVNQDDQGANSG